MLSIQEILEKTEQQRRRIEKAMDSFGYYHPDITVQRSTANIVDGLSLSDAHNVMQSIRQIPLREFLAKSGTAGMQGAAYLVPVKAHDLALNYSETTDKVPLISRQVIYDWKGDEWSLSVADDLAYRPQPFSSGGRLPSMEANFSQVGMAFDQDRTLGIHIAIGSDLLEDVADYDVLEWHVEQAGRAFGREATNRALAVLQTATDGVGTVNSAFTGDADETKLTGGVTSDIVTATRRLGDDRFIADTLITTTESWVDSISMQTALIGWGTLPPAPGFHNKIGSLDVLQTTSPNMHASTDQEGAVMTDCISIIYSRGDGLVTGRKRWLRLEQYAQPVSDLAGAVMVGAQDSVTIYDDSIYVLTET